MNLTHTQIAQGLEHGWPGKPFQLKGESLIWDSEANGPEPTAAELEAAWNAFSAAQIQKETQEAVQESTGLTALIASIGASNPDRALEPAKVRLGFALVVKALTKEPLILTTQQGADLDQGIQDLITHLQNPS